MNSSYFITTAIDYANGKPHIGHAYEKILADVIARVKRLQGSQVYFLTGLDEHGQKVEQAAKKATCDPLKWCDQMAVSFQTLCQKLNISYDDYIRTTQERHKVIVREILQKLFDKGEIYKASYRGYYSLREERFVQEKDKVDGEWPEIFGEVIQLREENYFFKLGKYQKDLMQFFEKEQDLVYPEHYRQQVLRFLQEPLNDLCISRPIGRMAWGIPLPFDSQYVTYVWFDALLNYFSAIQGVKAPLQWPADLQIIGKDIWIPAHAVYWIAMLKAAELFLPKHFLVHGWWLSKGSKLSKSAGMKVDPMELIEKYGADVLRYYMMREMVVGQDSEFSFENLQQRYRNELANDLGNLVNRCAHMLTRYCQAVVPGSAFQESLEIEVESLWLVTREEVLQAYNSFQFSVALDKIFNFVRHLNRYIEQKTPWRLAKQDDTRKELEGVLLTIVEGLRLTALLIIPIMPQIAQHILEQFSIAMPSKWEGYLNWDKAQVQEKSVQEIKILFPVIEE